MVQVSLDLEQNGECVQSTFFLSNDDDDLDELHDQGRRRAFIELDGRRSVIFDRETSSRLDGGHEKDAIYRVPRRNDETDECPPSFGIPCARITPVTPQSIQDWLIDDLDFLGAVSLYDPALADFEYETFGLDSWFVTPSRARFLEIAIRANTLEDGFMKWIESYRTSLEELERKRLEEMKVAEIALRARWQTERDGMLD